MKFYNDIQKAIYNALTADAPLMALITGVYDYVPQAADGQINAPFPFVTIGELNAQEFDSDTTKGARVSVVIHAWGRQRGRKEVNEVLGAIYEALHTTELTLVDGAFISLLYDNSQPVFTDADGKTEHGITVFNLMLTEN